MNFSDQFSETNKFKIEINNSCKNKYQIKLDISELSDTRGSCRFPL